MRIARIDQIRNSLFNRFEKLLKQAQVGNKRNEHQANDQKVFGDVDMAGV